VYIVCYHSVSGVKPAWVDEAKKAIADRGGAAKLLLLPGRNSNHWRTWWTYYLKGPTVFIFYTDYDLPLESGLYNRFSDNNPFLAKPDLTIHLFNIDKTLKHQVHTRIVQHYSVPQPQKVPSLIGISMNKRGESKIGSTTPLQFIRPSNYRRIAKLLEASSSDPSLSERVSRERILQLATVEQKLGNPRRAIMWLDKLGDPSAEYEPQVILLKGKLASQHGSESSTLREAIEALGDTRLVVSERDRLSMKSSLLWRLALLEAVRVNKNWENSLERQLELSRHPYLRVHYLQCKAMIGVFNSIIGNNDPETQGSALAEAFSEYVSMRQFEFAEKCLASNLIFRAVGHSVNGHPFEKFRCLLFARYLLENNSVKPDHEAMAETLRLLGPQRREFQAILFSDIRALTTRHSQGFLIAQQYFEICQQLCHSDTLDLASELLDEVY